jgi:hypothetical protein
MVGPESGKMLHLGSTLFDKVIKLLVVIICSTLATDPTTNGE